MARKRSKKQQRKQKARERRVRKDRKVLSIRREIKTAEKHVRRVAPLPEFRIYTTESTEDIAALVRAGVEGLDRTYTRTLDETTLSLMSAHVADGWTDLVNEQAAYITDMTRGDIEQSLKIMFEKGLGSGIMRNAPENLIRRAFPSSCFTMEPGERHWDIRCRSLRAIKTAHGRLYQSPHRPEVEWGGKGRQVAFTTHALTQLADRILPSWNKALYIGQVYVFGFLYECVYFEVITLENGQPALVVYNACLRSGAELRDYMRDLLKFKTDRELADYYYKVGYLPLVFDDDLAIAKTFLTPGYWHTPERRTISTAKGAKLTLARDIEQACDDGINIMSVLTCKRTQAAVKWFHNHGVPQAKKIDQEVFRDMAGPYSSLETTLRGPPTPEAS